MVIYWACAEGVPPAHVLYKLTFRLSTVQKNWRNAEPSRWLEEVSTHLRPLQNSNKVVASLHSLLSVGKTSTSHTYFKVLTSPDARSCSNVPYMEVSREVSDAVAKGQPVVALETTLVTHGLPHPENIKYVLYIFIFCPHNFFTRLKLFSIAMEMEEIVRSNDVVPATVGVLDGKIYVGRLTNNFYIPPKILSQGFFSGMSAAQMEKLAEVARLGRAVKISRQDLAYTLSQVI